MLDHQQVLAVVHLSFRKELNWPLVLKQIQWVVGRCLDLHFHAALGNLSYSLIKNQFSYFLHLLIPYLFFWGIFKQVHLFSPDFNRQELLIMYMKWWCDDNCRQISFKEIFVRAMMWLNLWSSASEHLNSNRFISNWLPKIARDLCIGVTAAMAWAHV